MSDLSFDQLDLSDIQEVSGLRLLTPGTYKVKVTEAEYTGEAGRKMLRVNFVDQAGHGTLRNTFNIVNPNPDAERIGRGELKAFLRNAGHPNPDKPGDVKSLIGLECVIVVGLGKKYRNSAGREVIPAEVKSFAPADSPVTGPLQQPQSAPQQVSSLADAAQRPAGLDDEIPF